MPENPEIFQPITNLTWRCGKCGRACSMSFIDCAGCGATRPTPPPVESVYPTAKQKPPKQLDAIAELSRANVSEATRSDSVVAEGVTLPVGEKPALPDTVPTPHQVLRQMVAKAGTQKAVAKELRISQQFICEVLNGRRDVSASLADKLGYQRMITFLRKP